MNWFKKLPGFQRTAAGLEWIVFRKLPLLLVVGTALPLIVLAVLHGVIDASQAAEQRWLQMANYMTLGVLAVHWSAIILVGFGCIVVMVMKGPAYVADGYPVSHSDKPREQPE